MLNNPWPKLSGKSMVTNWFSDLDVPHVETPHLRRNTKHDLFLLFLKGSKDSVPNNQHSTVVLVYVRSIGTYIQDRPEHLPLCSSVKMRTDNG